MFVQVQQVKNGIVEGAHRIHALWIRNFMGCTERGFPSTESIFSGLLPENKQWFPCLWQNLSILWSVKFNSIFSGIS
jgi:hypothetical protein